MSEPLTRENARSGALVRLTTELKDGEGLIYKRDSARWPILGNHYKIKEVIEDNISLHNFNCTDITGYGDDYFWFIGIDYFELITKDEANKGKSETTKKESEMDQNSSLAEVVTAFNKGRAAAAILNTKFTLSSLAWDDGKKKTEKHLGTKLLVVPNQEYTSSEGNHDVKVGETIVTVNGVEFDKVPFVGGIKDAVEGKEAPTVVRNGVLLGDEGILFTWTDCEELLTRV